MKTLKINDTTMPILGLGTWKSATGEVYNAVKEAIKLGYRHIDCAAAYGNEDEVGNAIQDCIKDGIVTREELWITSKLWNNMHGKDNVIEAIEATLTDLKLEYLDLYLIHWAIPVKKESMRPADASGFLTLEEQPIADTWLGMEETVKQGLAKNIGVCNFSIKKLSSLLENSSIKPCINQVEIHPYFQQKELVNFCHNNNIHLTAYSPLGSSDRPAQFKEDDEPVVLQDPTIKAIADKKGVSIAQVILAWDVNRGISVIPKSVNPERLKLNLEAASIELTDNEMELIANISINRRLVSGKFFCLEGGPHTLDSIWDE